MFFFTHNQLSQVKLTALVQTNFYKLRNLQLKVRGHFYIYIYIYLYKEVLDRFCEIH